MTEMAKSYQARVDAQAEQAQRLIDGGLPPYQAARKAGFMRVTAMNDAIKSLQNRTGAPVALKENDVTAPGAEDGDFPLQDFPEKKIPIPDTMPPEKQRSDPAYNPIPAYVNPKADAAQPLGKVVDYALSYRGFAISKIAPSGSYPAAIMLRRSEEDTHYIQFSASRLDDLICALRMITASEAQLHLNDKKEATHD
ncbi:MAG: hypothetical protein RR301_11620 [Clostridia bacterium]